MNQEQEVGLHSTLKMCAIIGISRSSYYSHLNLIISKRKRADQLSCWIHVFYVYINIVSTTGLNKKWSADITYIYSIAVGWHYLSTIMDLHFRKIIGYHFDQSI